MLYIAAGSTVEFSKPACLNCPNITANDGSQTLSQKILLPASGTKNAVSSGTFTESHQNFNFFQFGDVPDVVPERRTFGTTPGTIS